MKMSSTCLQTTAMVPYVLSAVMVTACILSAPASALSHRVEGLPHATNQDLEQIMGILRPVNLKQIERESMRMMGEVLQQKNCAGDGLQLSPRETGLTGPPTPPKVNAPKRVYPRAY